MPELNADIPVMNLGVYVRAEYLYDLQSHHGEFVPVDVFGVSSLPGRAVGFHVLTKDTGAVIWRLPVSSLVHNGGGSLSLLSDIPNPPLDHLELWNAFSAHIAVTEFGHLSERRCLALLKDGSRHHGRYVFTLDWWGTAYADNPGEGGHKCAHLIALDAGMFALLPNNRVLWADPATIAKPYAQVPDYRTNTRVWNVEHATKWVTSDDDRMFYGVEKSTS